MLSSPKMRKNFALSSNITLQAILVTEDEPPLGVEPITWLLLTTLSINNLEDVKQYVRWYSYRWLIERYHYVLKSGCQIEKLQLKTAQRNDTPPTLAQVVDWIAR